VRKLWRVPVAILLAAGLLALVWTGSLTVDLGHPQRLDGFGLTLGDTTISAEVSVSYATTAGAWQPLRDAQQASVPAAEPVYWPAPGGHVTARYVATVGG
jgi:hypothetical protein